MIGIREIGVLPEVFWIKPIETHSAWAPVQLQLSPRLRSNVTTRLWLAFGILDADPALAVLERRAEPGRLWNL